MNWDSKENYSMALIKEKGQSEEFLKRKLSFGQNAHKNGPNVPGGPPKETKSMVERIQEKVEPLVEEFPGGFRHFSIISKGKDGKMEKKVIREFFD